jgi:hypothetical protein
MDQARNPIRNNCAIFARIQPLNVAPTVTTWHRYACSAVYLVSLISNTQSICKL